MYSISLLTLIKDKIRNPLHHMTYAPAKFKDAMPNDLGGNAFTRNI